LVSGIRFPGLRATSFHREKGVRFFVQPLCVTADEIIYEAAMPSIVDDGSRDDFVEGGQIQIAGGFNFAQGDSGLTRNFSFDPETPTSARHELKIRGFARHECRPSRPNNWLAELLANQEVTRQSRSPRSCDGRSLISCVGPSVVE
jgi:hypothetical protein